jgi:hypothetical protein
MKKHKDESVNDFGGISEIKMFFIVNLSRILLYPISLIHNFFHHINDFNNDKNENVEIIIEKTD